MGDSFKATVAGAAGSVMLTTVHQVARHYIADAPRMDIVGMRALDKGSRTLDLEPVDRETRYNQALLGDLLLNTGYYSLVGAGGRDVWARGAWLGAAAGLGALVLPDFLGLGAPPHRHRPANQVMTVAWYLIGGLTAAAVSSLLSPPRRG